MPVRVFLLEEVCNRSPSLCANISRESTLPPLSFGVPTDRLPQISQHQGALEAARQVVLLFLYASFDAALSSSALRQRIPRVYAPLPEVEAAVDPRPDLPGLAGAQGLSQYHMGEDKGSLGITLPIEHPSPLRSQECSKPAPQLPWGHGVPAI